MKNATALARTLGLSVALAATGTAIAAAPASAAAAIPKPDCMVSHDVQPAGGWSVYTTFRSKGFTCKQAKAVINVCADHKTVAGWKIAKTDKGGYRFTNRKNSKQRFAVMIAGGAPDCIIEFDGLS